jgi:AraC-like DNA-binding protein
VILLKRGGRSGNETFLATMGHVVRLVEMYGIDGRALLREAGIDPAALRDPSARISSTFWDTAGAKAAALIPDPAFGLRAARCWHPSNLGALGYAWLASSTLRTGLQRLERYGRILGERATLTLTNSRDGLRFAYDHRRRNPLLRAIGTDFAMSIVLDMCRMNYGAALRPVEARLTRARPGDTEPYRHFYGCPIHFKANEDSFLISHRVADEPLSTANRQLAGTLDGILAAQLAALDRNNLPARCKSNLLEQLTSGEASEGDMARQLHMSRRTLQRRLAESNITYQKLVDDTRRDLALRYMEDPGKSITDVTFLLGFSGQSAFTRAFKRWTGMSPTYFREQKQVPATD